MKNLGTYDLRGQNLLPKIALQIYSALIFVLYVILALTAPMIPSLKRQFRGRLDALNSKPIANRAGKYIFFYCSSAGEYEQAKPLIDKWAEDDSFTPLIFFFSRSGLEYAQKRRESAPCFLSPVDCLWFWQIIYHRYQPYLTIVIRHEFWPSFMATAHQFGHLAAININARGSRGPWTSHKHFLTRKMLAWCDYIFTVTQRDVETVMSFSKNLRRTNCIAAGETKFDRVIQRQLNSRSDVALMRQRLSQRLVEGRRIVIGSAWPSDVDIIMPVFGHFKENWSIIIAPHDVRSEMIASITATCKSFGFETQLFSKDISHQDKTRVLILDTIGNLAEIYGCADAAFVGGAIHHQVHNVLEPACYGVPLAFGPKYHNSSEAKLLVDHGLAKVIHDSREVSSWWKALGSSRDLDMKSFIETMAGATNVIYNSLNPEKSRSESNLA